MWGGMTNPVEAPPPATHVLDCGHTRDQAVRAFEVGTRWWCDECKCYVWTVEVHPRLPRHERQP